VSKHPDNFKYVTHMSSVFGPIEVGPNELKSMPFLGLVTPTQVSLPAVVSSPNDERDRYIYEQFLAGIPLKAIADAVNKRVGWNHFADDPLGKVDAARKAMARYCKRHQLDIPTRYQKRNRQD
jgi:hypothetical protein